MPDPVGSRPIRLGISACLLGEEVRFDGGHKRDPFLTEMLARFVEYVRVCPEVEAGFGTPREPMRLVRQDGDIRLLTVKSGVDVTPQLARLVTRRVRSLDREDLSGYVLKKDSPSCGLERVKVYEGPVPARSGRGLFAAALVSRFPDLPVEEEGRLSDPGLRENFIERVFAYWRLRNLFRGRWTTDALVRFHTAHKLLLMAHAPAAYRALGRFVGGAAAAARDDVERQYSAGFMRALKTLATPGRHANVLQHMAGYLKDQLDAASKAELLASIDDHRRGLVPLIVPITLLRHHVRVHGIVYLQGQVYLEPHPRELMLRNHV